MRQAPTILEFRRDDTTGVLDLMREFHGGGGWINFHPAVDPDEVPPDSGGILALFSARGPQVPLCTWTPDEPSQRHPHVSLGLQHGTGGKAAPHLERLGVTVDARWRVMGDSPKRGMVVGVPADDPDDTVLRWLLDAGTALCPVDPMGRWVAEVYRSR